MRRARVDDVVGRRHLLLLPGVAVAEDHDVTAGDVVVEPVDQDPVADVQGLLHRLRGHPERLDEEGLDERDRDAAR